MRLITSVHTAQNIFLKLKQQGKRTGFVPTMGAFHEGHLSLMRQARKECDVVVVSLFVNPAQFGPKEDLSRYPRDLGKDRALAASAGADYLFVPRASDMYAPEFLTRVRVDVLSDGLCGRFRPGHFDGVVLVVAKLLNIVQPERMFLGQKDAQQVAVIRRMTDDLNFSVKLRVCPVVREKDGLAMSSRNRYLSDEDRVRAAGIYAALSAAREAVARGESDAQRIILQIKQLINDGTGASIEYVSCVDIKTLKDVGKINGKVMIAVAARVGNTRLIDNIIVRPSS
jgi:pantoate--beta-alanine ligase